MSVVASAPKVCAEVGLTRGAGGALQDNYTCMHTHHE